MISNKEPFSNVYNTIKFEIMLGDDHLVDSLRKGIVSVIIKQNEKKDIPNVHFVKGLENNLLSVG